MESYRPNLFPRCRRVAEFVGSLLVPFHEPVEPYLSEHYKVDEMLLNEQQELPYEKTDS